MLSAEHFAELRETCCKVDSLGNVQVNETRPKVSTMNEPVTKSC